MNHVYVGVRYEDTEMWNSLYVADYLQTLRSYSDQVVLEVSGHDHYADFRYHSSNDIRDLENTPTEFKFHNLIVAPGISPNKN